jgi:hypothetical protein
MSKYEEKLKTIIDDYFEKIDDYYEAKDELIKDINKHLVKRGDYDGMMCKYSFKQALKELNKL